MLYWKEENCFISRKTNSTFAFQKGKLYHTSNAESLVFLLFFVCVKTIVLLIWVPIEYATKDKSIIKVSLLCFLENNRMLKLALANGLWIGITPKILPNLMMEKTLMTCYHCHTILVKLRYTNKGSTIGQHAFKEDVVSLHKISKVQ
jgi:hypothetical protein